MEHITLELAEIVEGVETVKIVNGKRCVFKLITVSESIEESSSPATPKSQQEVIESLYGSWSDDETADELLARIKSTRKNTEVLPLE